jgi:hypothetical protein
MAMLYNPLPTPVDRRIRIPLYFSGLRNAARVRIGEAEWTTEPLNPAMELELAIHLPSRSHLPVWFAPANSAPTSAANSEGAVQNE